MPGQQPLAALNILKNRIDITHVPFSDRGSRLLVYQEPVRSRLSIKLAERLTGLESNIEAYLHRPPFIRELCLLDEAGQPLEFEVTTQPHILRLKTHLGEFGLVFLDRRTLVLGLPAEISAGLRFHVSPQFWQERHRGGRVKAVRNLVYATNGEASCNRIMPDEGGYTVEFVVKVSQDCAIALSIGDNL